MSTSTTRKDREMKALNADIDRVEAELAAAMAELAGLIRNSKQEQP